MGEQHDYSSAISDGRFQALSSSVGGDSHPYVIHQTLADARANDGSNVTRQPSPATTARECSVNTRDSLGISAIIRAQRDRDFLATIAEWQRASGSDRAYWRRYVRLAIAEERARIAKYAAALKAAAARRDAA